jgi:hypothetical protein
VSEDPKAPAAFRPAEHWTDQPDPLMEAASAARESLRLQLRAVGQMLRYPDYADSLTADQFYRLVRIALLDSFFSWTDEEKAGQLGIGEADLEWGRDHPDYERMCDDARAKLRAFATGVGIDDRAAGLEDEMAIQAAMAALYSPLPKDRLAATGVFLDRRSAKKTRDEGGRELVIPAGFVELIEAATKLFEARQKALPPPSEDDVIEISARRVPMPAEG